MLKNRQNKLLFIFSGVVIVVISSIAIVLSSVALINQKNRKKNAQSIFTECIDNVVELKAETDEIGESFGTAVLISKDGTFITNAHIITYNSLGTSILFDKLNIRFAHEEEPLRLRTVAVAAAAFNMGYRVYSPDPVEALTVTTVAGGGISGYTEGKVHGNGYFMHYHRWDHKPAKAHAFWGFPVFN